MSEPSSNGIGSSRAYEAARLRWAAEVDAARLARLWRASRAADGRPQDGETEDEMHRWLEHGGAVLLEDESGTALCAVRWCWADDGGWRVDPIATLEEARGRGYGRWLMTKLEALAIKRNVPTLTLDLERPDLLPYYLRLGYRRSTPGVAANDGAANDGEANDGVANDGVANDAPSDGSLTLVKRVGGTWQRQPGSAR